MDLDERLARADRLQICGESDVATLAGDVRTLVAELRAARAEVERLRTAAADERADVVAQLTKLANFLGRAGTKADTYASDVVRGAAALLAAGTHEGAHVGAAKGGDHD